MDLTLTYIRTDHEGAFANVTDDTGALLMVTGTHTFLQADGVTWAPIEGTGQWVCVRGTHTINNPTPQHPNATKTFETFEITGIAGHSGLLFHWGNVPETQSEGCHLTGESFGEIGGLEAVLNSVTAFEKFMAAQAGVDSFVLTVQ
jgi:hypothetical protein